jgi:hypothetical protein
MRPFTEGDGNDVADERSANPGYVLGQLAAAFRNSQEHADSATRRRAVKKIDNWVKVFTGMLSGTLRVGARTPVTDTPAWATLEVVQGGFATGELLAGGALQAHEKALLERLTAVPSAPPRTLLNSYYLGDDGITELQRRVKTGCYRVNVPDEGALPVIAWLLEHGYAEAARDLLSEIGPFLDRLRFYPIPTSQPLTDSSHVSLQTIGQTIQSLMAIQAPKRLLAQREAAQIWAPLCDRAVALFLETIEGPVPTLQTGPDGKPLRRPTGSFLIEGGWPCQHYSEGWTARAKALLEDYRRLRLEHSQCGKPERKGENFAILREYLKICASNPHRLTGRDVGRIRQVLAGIVTRRGVPRSERSRSLRQFQSSIVNRPTHADLAQVVIHRMTQLPPDDGLPALDEVLAPVTAQEAVSHGLEPDQPLAEPLAGKVRRCLAAPVETLVEMEIITSGEVLARVIPQITAQVRAAGLADPDLRRLYGAIYQAFRRRRSLLLLNLESQVKLTELPWVRAIEAHRERDQSTQELALQTLEQVARLAITSFPQQILPNKLLQEVRALAEGAGLRLPLVDEVAADIFMGAFTEKFLRAAQVAGTLLEGTLYERYYGLSYARVRRIDDVRHLRHITPTSPMFFELCSELAGPAGDGSWVARNGMIIEQEQILTTHNLAVLFTALGLADTLRPHLGDLARRCFEWICRRQRQQPANWRARLQAVKNSAYAWRQMIFFLALEPDEVVRAFLTWASDHLSQQHPEFAMRFQPALNGLDRAIHGLSPEDAAGKATRFLGWSQETHWLLQ